MSLLETSQEKIWAGSFGDDFVARLNEEKALAGNLALFSRILKTIEMPTSLLEYGAGTGINLQAIKLLVPNIDITAVEVNAVAVERLRRIAGVNVEQCSLLQHNDKREYEMVLLKCVLIHTDECQLAATYEKITRMSSKYICIAEYYNPTPLSVNYRGHEDFLVKRDFAGELMERYPEWSLEDYGFVYHQDPAFPLDDITWFLLRRQ